MMQWYKITCRIIHRLSADTKKKQYKKRGLNNSINGLHVKIYSELEMKG